MTGVAQQQSHWIILRMAGQRTLAVAASLAQAGFEVWTPTEIQKKQVSRLRQESQTVAITPSFVFVSAKALDDILAILAAPINPHPAFTVFRFGDRIPAIRDKELRGLRVIEDRSKFKEKRSRRYIYPRGSRVRTDEPAFVGLSGIVEGGDSKHAVVSFGSPKNENWDLAVARR